MSTTSTIAAPQQADLATARRQNEQVWAESSRLLYSGQIEDFLTCWHEDAAYEVAYPVAGFPPVVQGHDALRAMFGGFGAAAESIEVHDVTFHQTDDPQVAIVEERMVATLRDGSNYENRLIIRVRFRDGLIAEMFEYYGQIAHEGLLRRLGFVD